MPIRPNGQPMAGRAGKIVPRAGALPPNENSQRTRSPSESCFRSCIQSAFDDLLDSLIVAAVFFVKIVTVLDAPADAPRWCSRRMSTPSVWRASASAGPSTRSRASAAKGGSTAAAQPT